MYNLTVKCNVHDFGVIHKRKEDFLEKKYIGTWIQQKVFLCGRNSTEKRSEKKVTEKRSEDTTFTSATYHSWIWLVSYNATTSYGSRK